MAYSPESERAPRGISLAVTAGILTMIASVIIVLALFTWQPWKAPTTGSGIQGGGDAPAPEHQRVLPASR